MDWVQRFGGYCARHDGLSAYVYPDRGWWAWNVTARDGRDVDSGAECTIATAKRAAGAALRREHSASP